MTSAKMVLRFVAVLAAVVLTVAGCGSGDDTGSQQNSGGGGDTSDSPDSDDNGNDDAPAGDVVSAAPDASPYILGFGDLSAVSLPDGEPGVSIIASGTVIDERGTVTVVVRNNTSETVGGIEVTGTARDSDGALVASGSSQGFEPVVVEPGEIAFGCMYFDISLAETSGLDFEFDVDADPVTGSFLPVTVTEINNTGDQLVGAVTNDNDGEVSGPIGVSAICFGADGNIVDFVDTYTDQDDLDPGANGSFSIGLYGAECPAGLAGASGYSF